MKRSIIHVLDINTQLDTISNALTTIDGLKSWWTTNVSGFADEAGIIEFRFATVFGPDMKVVKSTPLCIEWECVAGVKEWAGDSFTFALADTGERIMLTFNQEYANDITAEQYGRFNFNWGYYLNSLKQYCETGKGMPFQPK